MMRSTRPDRHVFIFVILCFALTGFISCAGSGKTHTAPADSTQLTLERIILPKPRTEGGMPLMQALKERQTTRQFSTEQLSLQTLSDLLWAAFGINRQETGKRTAPSAVNWQEIDIYVALARGLYVYEPKAHVLNPVLARDLRARTTRTFQPSRKSVDNAPVTFIYVADLNRIDGIGRLMKDDSKLLTANAGAGFIGQNVYLFCASEGLGTVVRAMIDRPVLREEMHLGPSQHIILCQTIGYPEGGPAPASGFDLMRTPDGAYQGDASFEGHDYEVEVIVKDRRISEVKMLKIGTGEHEINAKAVIGSVVDAQSTKVDAISGATQSSRAILMAIENALSGANSP
jgi:nitroreductase